MGQETLGWEGNITRWGFMIYLFLNKLNHINRFYYMKYIFFESTQIYVYLLLHATLSLPYVTNKTMIKNVEYQ